VSVITIDIKKLLNNEILIIGFIVSVAIYTLSNSIGFTPISLFFGLIGFIFIPGFMFACILRKKILIDAIGYSFILGLALQILLIAFYSIISSIIHLDFNILLIMTSAFLLVVLRTLVFKMRVTLGIHELKITLEESFRNPLTYVFIFAFVIRLYYISFNTESFMPDAALYLDSSRTLVLKGIFSSNVLYDESLGALAKNGLIDHSFIIYLFGIFFKISTVSLSSALITIAFLGAILVYPIYSLATAIFGKSVGLLAAIILSIHPLFIYYSATVFGPEISGLIFLIASLYLAIEGFKAKSLSLLLLSGLFLGISEELWWYPFYVVVFLIPFIFVIYYDRSKPTITNKRFMLNTLIAISCLLAYTIALKLGSLYYLYIPIVLFEIILFILSYKIGCDHIYLASSFVVGIIIPTMISIIKNYLVPSSVNLIVQEANTVGLIPSMFNAFTFFFKSSSLSGGAIDLSRYLTNYATIFVIILFFLAFMSSNKIKIKLVLGGIILLNCILLALRPPPTYPEYLSSNGRYYLLPISLMIIVGSTFLIRFAKLSTLDLSSITIRLKKKNKMIRLSLLSSILVVSILLGLFFIPEYQSNLELISNDKPLEKYGWSNNMLNWISNNTGLADTLLTSRARELAWLTNRATVVVDNGTAGKLDELSIRFNATYLVTDDYLYWTSPSLRDFSTSMTQIGEILMPSDTILSILSNSSISSNSYKLDYSDSSKNLKIWKIIPPDRLLLDSEVENISSSVWMVGNGEKKVKGENAFSIIIGENNTYAYTYTKYSTFNISMPKDAAKFFAWNLTNIYESTLQRIELWENGQHISDINPPSTVGVWITNLQTSKIDDLRIVISGNATGYISVNWLAIGSYIAFETPNLS
jgi:hypothetical protein